MSTGAVIRKIKMVDLSNVQVRPATVHDPEISVSGRGKVGVSTTQAMELFTQVCKLTGLTSTRPASLQVGEDEENPQITYLQPVQGQSASNLEVTWSEDGQTPYIKMGKLLKARGIAIPPKSRMVIKVTVEEDVPDFGPALILHLGDAEFVPLGEGTRKKKAQ